MSESARVSSPASAPPVPRFGRYSVLMPISSGRETGIWWARLHQGAAGFEKDFVVKAVHPERVDDPEVVSAFLDEARLAARMCHPQVVQVFELGAEVGIPYIAMERISGPTLAALQRRIGRLEARPYGAIAWTMAQLCRGLAHIHELCDEDDQPLGLVHGDLRLDNIIVSPVGGPKIVDFGVAAALQRGIGPLAGQGPAADLFQVGVLLHWLCTGQPPYPDDSLRSLYEGTVQGEMVDPITLSADLPPALASILSRALSRDPSRRQAAAHLLAEELDAFCASLEVRPTADSVGALVLSLMPPPVAPASGGMALEDLERTFTIRTALLVNQRSAAAVSGLAPHPAAAFLASVILVFGLAYAAGYL